MLKVSKTELAKYLGKHQSSIYYMQKKNPKQFELLWLGWTMYCQNQKKD